MTQPPTPAPEPPAGQARRATSSVQIYDALRHRIVTGDLRPMQCVSETELAASLGVSRTPVREALGKLEEEGLVDIRPRFGTFVAPILPASVLGSHFVRQALECTAIEAAASRCTATGQRELEDILATQQRAADDDAFCSAGDALHRALMTIAGQHAAWNVVQTAKAVLDRVRSLALQRQTTRTAILCEHQHIVDRVAAHDPAGATRAMRDHLHGVFAAIETSMTTHPELFTWDQDLVRPKRRGPGHSREPSEA